MLTVTLVLLGSGKSRTRKSLASLYSVMPSTLVSLTAAPGFAGAALTAEVFAAACGAWASSGVRATTVNSAADAARREIACLFRDIDSILILTLRNGSFTKRTLCGPHSRHGLPHSPVSTG